MNDTDAKIEQVLRAVAGDLQRCSHAFRQDARARGYGQRGRPKTDRRAARELMAVANVLLLVGGALHNAATDHKAD